MQVQRHAPHKRDMEEIDLNLDYGTPNLAQSLLLCRRPVKVHGSNHYEITDLLTVRRKDVSEKVKIMKNSPKIITIYLIKILLHQIELLINLLLFRSRSQTEGGRQRTTKIYGNQH
jgi:hypothetical protein